MKRIFGLLFILLLAGCNVNSSLSVADGATHDGDLSTVNGSVSIGKDSQVYGDASTVNGSIAVGDRANVYDASSVNGSVRIGDGATIRNAEAVNGSIVSGSGVVASGSFETVNGRIEIGSESVIENGIATVNGNLLVRGAEVGSISTVNGDITLEANSQVNGEIVVQKPRNWGSDSPGIVKIEIGANSNVVGPLRFEREVVLRIHQSATVGEIIGAEPVYFND